MEILFLVNVSAISPLVFCMYKFVFTIRRSYEKNCSHALHQANFLLIKCICIVYFRLLFDTILKEGFLFMSVEVNLWLLQGRSQTQRLGGHLPSLPDTSYGCAVITAMC